MEQQEFLTRYSRDRWGTDCLKWDGVAERYGRPGLLPVWVADMDFAVPEAVQQALTARVKAGIFGYSLVPADYFAAYQGWQSRHFGTKFQKEWLFFTTGVVQGLYDLIDCFTAPGDSVLVQPPVYYPFFEGIKNKHRHLVVSPLQKTAAGYQMDLVDFEDQIIDQQVKLFILCSPHNPVGRVWTATELSEVLAICRRHQVLVISDEIHSDFVSPGQRFVSALSVGEPEDLIVCNAPSKTFNLATLLNAHIWIPSEKRRTSFAQWTKENRATENSSLGQLAAMTAYQSGDEWFAALQQVIWRNASYLEERFQQELPLAEVAELQGTYLLWVDLSKYQIDDLPTFMEKEAGLAVDYGSWFAPESQHYIRINLATTPERITQVADRLIHAAKTLQKAGN